MRTDFNQRPGRPKRRGGHSFGTISGKHHMSHTPTLWASEAPAPDTYNLMEHPMMGIPGPIDLVRVAGQGYDALDRVIGLVPRLVRMVSDVEGLIGRAQLVVSDIEVTQQRATAAVEHIEAAQQRAN